MVHVKYTPPHPRLSAIERGSLLWAEVDGVAPFWQRLRIYIAIFLSQTGNNGCVSLLNLIFTFLLGVQIE